MVDVGQMALVILLLCILLVIAVCLSIGLAFGIIALGRWSRSCAKTALCLFLAGSVFLSVLYFGGLPSGGRVRVYMPYFLMSSVILTFLSAVLLVGIPHDQNSRSD